MKNFQRVLERVDKAKTIADLKRVVEDFDRDFDAGVCEMQEEDWPVLTSAIATRKAQMEKTHLRVVR